MSPWGEAEAWDRLVNTTTRREFADLWLWNRDVLDIERAVMRERSERVYDWQQDGL